MPKKKKVKKVKKAKKTKNKISNKIKTPLKSSDKKNTISGVDEKPEIKKIKKQPTEKKIYNLKDFVVYPKHGVGKITSIEKEITLFHAEISKKAILQSVIDIDFVGFHGQTIYHNPDEKITVFQLQKYH